MALGMTELDAPSPHRTREKDRGKAGGTDKLDKVKVAAMRFTNLPGHDSSLGRRSTPETTVDRPKGKERALETERKFSPDLVRRFTDDLRSDLDQLIEMRRDPQFTSTAEFKQFLRDSGHDYYNTLYDRMVTSKPGTRGKETSLSIKEDALQEFMGTDKGFALAYEIRQKKFQEQALAAAVVFGVNAAEPRDGTVLEGDMQTGKGNILNKAGRAIRRQWQTPVGKIHGRDKPESRYGAINAARATVDKRGNVIMTLGGSAIVLGAIGGLVTGGNPLGIALGAAVPEIAAAIKHGMKPGETIDINLSPAALRAMQGDPTGDPARNAARLEWSKKFNNLDPNDWEITRTRRGREEIRLRTDIIHGSGIDPRTLREHLDGTALDLKRFREANGIRREYDRPMDLDWLLDGTKNRPRHGTPFEQKVMAEFNANGEGLQDRYGNTRERNQIPLVPVVETRRIETRARDDRGQIIMEGGTPRMVQATNPDGSPATDPSGNPIMTEARDSGGNVIMDGQTPRIESTVVPIMEQARDASGQLLVDSRGEPIMVPRITEIADPSGGRLIDEFGQRRMLPDNHRITADNGSMVDAPDMDVLRDSYGNPVLDRHGDPVYVPQMRNISERDIQYRNLTNPDGSPRSEPNPHFDPRNLDVVGNVERWNKAKEKVLKAELNDVFRSLVEGKIDYQSIIFDQIAEKKNAAASGERFEAEKRSRDKEKKRLETERDIFDNERTKAGKYFSETAVVIRDIEQAEERQRLAYSKITAENGDAFTDSAKAREALAAVLKAGNASTIVIGGERITSIPDDIRQLTERLLAERTTALAPHIDALNRAQTEVGAARRASNRLTSKVNSLQQSINAFHRVTRGPDIQIAQAEIQRLTPDLEAAQLALENEEARLAAAELAERERRSILSQQESALQHSQEAIRDQEMSRIKRQQELASNILKIIADEEANITELRSTDIVRDEFARRDFAAEVLHLENGRALVEGNGTVSLREMQESSFHELMEIINEEHEADPAYGWSKDDNNTSSHRRAVLYAMTEAKAAQTAEVRDPGNDFRDFKKNWKFGDVDLLTYSPGELAKRIESQELPQGVTSRPTEQDIKVLRGIAQKRFDARQRAMEATLNNIKKRLETLELTEESFLAEGLHTPQLDAIERAMNRYDAIQDKIMDQLPDDTDLDRFFENADASTHPELYSPAEQAHNIAYVNTMSLIFDHRAGSESNVTYRNEVGNEAALRRNMEVLNPDTLTELMRDYFELRGVSATAGFGDAVNIARGQLGEDFRTQFAEFLTEGILMSHLSKAVDRY